MGDRANIVVFDGTDEAGSPHEAVFLYGHWSGFDMPASLKSGLVKGRDRWNDAQYLARIVFQALVGDDSGTTGYGIATRMGDNGYPLLVIDVPRQVVVEYPEDVYAEHGFAKLGDFAGVPLDEYSGKWDAT